MYIYKQFVSDDKNKHKSFLINLPYECFDNKQLGTNHIAYLDVISTNAFNLDWFHPEYGMSRYSAHVCDYIYDTKCVNIKKYHSITRCHQLLHLLLRTIH